MLYPTSELTPILFPSSEPMLVILCFQPQSWECPILPHSQYWGQNISIPSNQCWSCFIPNLRVDVKLFTFQFPSCLPQWSYPSPSKSRFCLESHFQKYLIIYPLAEKLISQCLLKLISRDKTKNEFDHTASAYCLRHAYLTSHNHPLTQITFQSPSSCPV